MVDWCEESDDDEEDSYTGSIEGEEEGKKNEFLHVISRDNSVKTTKLQGLSTDPEGQESQIRPEEDLPKECLQSFESRVEGEIRVARWKRQEKISGTPRRTA